MPKRKRFLYRGRSYHHFIALCEGPIGRTKKGKTYRQWWLICCCGDVVLRNLANVTSGRTRSCGCQHGSLRVKTKRIAAQRLAAERKAKIENVHADGSLLISEELERERIQKRLRRRKSDRDPFISALPAPPSVLKLGSS